MNRVCYKGMNGERPKDYAVAIESRRMLLDAIVQPISDISTVAAQWAVERIADATSLRRDGWMLVGVKVLVACVVFLAVAVAIPIAVLATLWWLGLKLLSG